MLKFRPISFGQNSKRACNLQGLIKNGLPRSIKDCMSSVSIDLHLVLLQDRFFEGVLSHTRNFYRFPSI